MRVRVCINTPDTPTYSMYNSYSHLYCMQVKVCINTPHTPTCSMYNTYLHLYAGQGLYKYTIYTYMQYEQFSLTPICGSRGMYRTNTPHTPTYSMYCTIHTYTYMRDEVCINTPKYIMYISYLLLYAGQDLLYKYSRYVQFIHLYVCINTPHTPQCVHTHTCMRIRECTINTPNTPTVCYTFTSMRVWVGINTPHTPTVRTYILTVCIMSNCMKTVSFKSIQLSDHAEIKNQIIVT